MKNNFDARQYIMNALGNNANDSRIREELNLISPKNFMEIFYAKKIADFLKENNEYYIVRGIYGNLFINFLLGISDVDSYELPYEFVFNKKDTSFVYEFHVSESIEPKLINYLDKLSMGIMARTSTACLLPYTDQLIGINDYINKNHNTLIEIGITKLSSLDRLNENIKKYGLPEKSILEDEAINKEIFQKLNLDGITYSNTKCLKNLIPQCELEECNFYTYIYLLGIAHGKGISEQMNSKRIDEKTMLKYPTNREDLYNLLLNKGISKGRALEIVYFTRLGKKYRLKNIEKWEILVNSFPKYLKDYLNEIDSIFPKYHLIAFAKMNYLEIYYRILENDVYNDESNNGYYFFTEKEKKIITIEQTKYTFITQKMLKKR